MLLLEHTHLGFSTIIQRPSSVANSFRIGIVIDRFDDDGCCRAYIYEGELKQRTFDLDLCVVIQEVL